MISLVRAYAEEGRLPPHDVTSERASVRQVTASVASLDRLLRTLDSDAAKDPLTRALNRRPPEWPPRPVPSKRHAVSVAIFVLDELKGMRATPRPHVLVLLEP